VQWQTNNKGMKKKFCSEALTTNQKPLLGKQNQKKHSVQHLAKRERTIVHDLQHHHVMHPSNPRSDVQTTKNQMVCVEEEWPLLVPKYPRALVQKNVFEHSSSSFTSSSAISTSSTSCSYSVDKSLASPHDAPIRSKVGYSASQESDTPSLTVVDSKDVSQEQNVATTTISIKDIPVDVIANVILPFLLVKEILRCRLISKSWCEGADVMNATKYFHMSCLANHVVKDNQKMVLPWPGRLPVLFKPLLKPTFPPPPPPASHTCDASIRSKIESRDGMCFFATHCKVYHLLNKAGRDEVDRECSHYYDYNKRFTDPVKYQQQYKEMAFTYVGRALHKQYAKQRTNDAKIHHMASQCHTCKMAFCKNCIGRTMSCDHCNRMTCGIGQCEKLQRCRKCSQLLCKECRVKDQENGGGQCYGCFRSCCSDCLTRCAVCKHPACERCLSVHEPGSFDPNARVIICCEVCDSPVCGSCVDRNFGYSYHFHCDDCKRKQNVKT